MKTKIKTLLFQVQFSLEVYSPTLELDQRFVRGLSPVFVDIYIKFSQNIAKLSIVTLVSEEELLKKPQIDWIVARI